MASTDFGSLNDEQLVHTELGFERALVQARFRHYTNQLEDTASLAKLRKDIARCQTEARRRELEQGLGKNALRDRHRGSFDPATAAAAEGEGEGGFLAGIVDKLKSDD